MATEQLVYKHCGEVVDTDEPCPVCPVCLVWIRVGEVDA
jgi:tRNA(Arg) A34 adenosine deaminase TadA